MLERHSKRVTWYFWHINAIIVRVHIASLLVIKMPGMPRTQTWRRAALLAVAPVRGSPGPPPWDRWERFSSGCGACPWSCGFDTEALFSAKDSVLGLQGSLHCPLRCCTFILGKALSFPGDEAWAACSSLSGSWRPAVLFCYSGFHAWVWGMRIPSQGNHHDMLKMGAIPPSSGTFFVVVCTERLWWCF